MKRMHVLKTKLKRLLLDRSPVNVRVNSSLSADPYAEDDDTDKYLSNTLSIAFEGMLSSSLLSMMGSKLCTSAGAACHSAEAISVSEVLRAVHCPLSYAIGTLRLSVGRYTTEQDVEDAAEIIIAAVYKLLEQPSVNQKLAWELYNLDPGGRRRRA